MEALRPRPAATPPAPPLKERPPVVRGGHFIAQNNALLNEGLPQMLREYRAYMVALDDVPDNYVQVVAAYNAWLDTRPTQPCLKKEF